MTDEWRNGRGRDPLDVLEHRQAIAAKRSWGCAACERWRPRGGRCDMVKPRPGCGFRLVDDGGPLWAAASE